MKALRFLPAVIWTVMIVVLSLLSSEKLPNVENSLVQVDKLAHFLVYFILSVLFALGIAKKERGILVLFCVFMFGTFLGTALEYFQKCLTDTRHFDYYDMLANCFGSFFGCVIYLKQKIKI